jgi:hypothetical protein
MSAEGQEIIARVRELLGKSAFAEAADVLAHAPKDRSEWTAHENDEILCLQEFLSALQDPSFT